MGTIKPTLDHDGRLVTPQAQRLVSDKTGVLTGLYQSRLDSREDPGIFFVHVEETNLEPLVGHAVDDLNAGGKEMVARDSALAALGEAAERYCFHFTANEPDAEATHDELVAAGERVVEHDYLRFLDDEQYAAAALAGEPFRRDTTVHWSAGTNLLTGEPTYLPTQLVFDPIEGEYPIYFTATTNGMATGTSLRMALRNGIEELIERDGFMRAWCTQRAPSRVDLRNFPEVRELKESRFESAALDYHLLMYDNPTEVTAVACTIVNRRDEAPNFVLGGSAALSPKEAMVDAMVEASQAWHSQIMDDLLEGNDGPDEVNTLKDGVGYYAQPENFEDVAFLLDGDTVVPEPRDDDAPDGLAGLLDALAAADVTPVAIDLTRPDVRELGWRVTKVFVPELVALSLPAQLPRNHPAFDGVDVTEKPHPYP